MKNQGHFFELTPESILDSVEFALGARATGRALALNSLENRVYDVEMEDGEHVVAKFYRPDRWTFEQILEEHAFLFALEDAEVPVIAPLLLDGESLFETEQEILFTIFPKVSGRLLDELDKERLKILGRYIARIHNVGEHFPSRYRLHLNADTWGREPLQYLLGSDLLDPVYQKRYSMIAETIFSKTDQILKGAKSFLIHGDCHLGNTLWQGDSPFFLDFDDSMVAPPVQDIWMAVRGRDAAAEKDREALLEGYEVFRAFDRNSLHSIEVLRALRMIHYSAWIARRWEDPSFKRAFPQFATPRYWEEEINSLQEILSLCEHAPIP